MIDYEPVPGSVPNVVTQMEGPIEYDPVAGKITNNERANALLTSKRRKGWEL